MSDKIEYQICTDGGYLHNALICRRSGDPSPAMFTQDHEGKSIIPRLNGYAIIPIGLYHELIGTPDYDPKFVALMAAVKDCDERLYGEDASPGDTFRT